jgi:hypothetical protein
MKQPNPDKLVVMDGIPAEEFERDWFEFSNYPNISVNSGNIYHTKSFYSSTEGNVLHNRNNLTAIFNFQMKPL